MKTLKQWDESGLDLGEFLNPLDEIDSALYDHFAFFTPKYQDENLVQMCSPDYEKDGILFIMTASIIEDKYYYLGKLPMFGQNEYGSRENGYTHINNFLAKCYTPDDSSAKS